MGEMDNGTEQPTWLSQSYIEDTLQKYLKDNSINIHQIKIRPATASGQNYASVMSRITVSYRSARNKTLHELSFLVKYSFESDPYAAKILGAYDIYNTEMKMYDQILPQLARILSEAGEKENLFAETLRVDFDNSAIMFEDLTRKNYVSADRLIGLDEIHCLMVMKKLAKFHAATAVLNERCNGDLEKLDRGLFNRHIQGGLGHMYEYFLEVCANFARTCPELGQYYYDKLMKLQPFIVNYATKAYNSNKKHFLTLTHGDLWITNTMMLYNKSNNMENQLKDILFIDFQFSNWASVAVDLYYFFHTSLEPKLMLDFEFHQKLIQYYHSVLKDMLCRLKYKGYIPTLHELCVQLEEGKFLAVADSVANCAVAIAEECEGADFHCLVDNIERAKVFRANCYKNKRLQELLKVKLPYFDRCGLLDVQK